MNDSFLKTPTEVLRHFSTDASRGLDGDQVERQRKEFGRNELPREEGTSILTLIIKQFDDFLVQILLVAAVVSVFASEEEWSDHQLYVEPGVILLILILNAIVGVSQELKAEADVEALREYEPDSCLVIRNGAVKEVASAELVPGDLIEVRTGAKVPADCRVVAIESNVLKVDQSMLTGESEPVSKIVEPIKDAHAVYQDKINMLFSGTSVEKGTVKAVVTMTGANSAIGEINAMLSEETDDMTPLKKQLEEFAEDLGKYIMWICLVVFLLRMAEPLMRMVELLMMGSTDTPNTTSTSTSGGEGFYTEALGALKTAIALAVAAIPEGLSFVVTICLTLGTRRMAKKNAIVRSLPSVETLGCTSVICSDKTGTLTTNKMSVQKVVYLERTDDGLEVVDLDVSGSSYSPHGDICDPETGLVMSNPATEHSLEQIGKIASLCNDATIHFDESSDSFDRLGEPTEAALKVLSEKIGTPDGNQPSGNRHAQARHAHHYWRQLYQRKATLEFTRDRKSMSVLCATRQNGNFLFVKGAVESILDRCKYIELNSGHRTAMTAQTKELLLDVLGELAGGEAALRCLGFAYKEKAPYVRDLDLSDESNYVAYESGLTFVGIAGMIDPPRPEVRDAIATCKAACINVIVITGDNKLTAQAICKQIGIFEKGEDMEGKAYTGREFEMLTDAEKVNAVHQARLFCRVEPHHKRELVEILKREGAITAMTGDGVNDAPALKGADIGIAMGTGTDVAKGASDMVLADDNFATIVTAVEEGRSIYNNTKQFIRYLISSNIGEVACIFLVTMLGLPDLLIPVQLLWVNLVTDGLPATALSFNPAEKGLMQREPRKSDEKLIDGWLFFRYCLIGVYVGIATVGAPLWYLSATTLYKDLLWNSSEVGANVEFKAAMTIALSVLVTIEMLNALNSVSENDSIVVLTPFANPYLIFAVMLSMALHFMILYIPIFAGVFKVVPLDLDQWMIVLVWSFPVILLDELLKAATRSKLAAEKKNQ